MVITIMGVLMGIGAGVWVSFRSGSARRRAYRALSGACRRARVFSLEETAPSRLVLDRRGGRFHAEGLRLVGFWHLEGSGDPAAKEALEPGSGFAGRDLQYSGGTLAAGFRGTCLEFGEGGSVVMEDGAFRLPRGGQFSCYLFPTAARRRQNILTRGKELSFVITQEDELEARVGSALVTAAGYRLPLFRWSHLALFYSPEEVTIAVNGVVRARTAPDEVVEMPDLKEADLPLEMGTGEWVLFGRVDEIAIHRAVREPAFRLPEGLTLEGSAGRLHFDSAGGLDRRYHNGPVRVGIKAPEPGAPGGAVTRWVTVGLTGEIREE